MKVYFVSLGCDKNLVDSEYMLGLLRDAGHTLTEDEAVIMNEVQLLTMKPIIYVANVADSEAAEEPLSNEMYVALKKEA